MFNLFLPLNHTIVPVFYVLFVHLISEIFVQRRTASQAFAVPSPFT